MINIEQALEFNTIKEQLKQYAYTKQAKEKIEQLKPCLSQIELKRQLRDTTEAKRFLEIVGTPPLSCCDEADEILAIAQKGGCLTGEQLEQVAFMLTTMKRTKDYLNRGKQYEIGIAYEADQIDSLDDVREEIQCQIREGKVQDQASKTLRTLRSEIEATREKIRQKADNMLRAKKKYMTDQYATLKNGHYCLPVKKEYKNQIEGSVVEQSASGNTVFMEPIVVAKQYEQLQYMEFEEENEVRRILYTLTDLVAGMASIVEQNKLIIEKLDFFFAKGKLSLDFHCCEPKINTERYIKMKNGRHPLMKIEEVVPLQFEIGGNTQGIIITGPNTGGKTVTLKTVALNSMMAQCGLHVACQEADICMSNQYLCDIGDGQDLTQNLSTFSAHITNVLEILRKVDQESLVIMDELGSGTDPTEGMGVAIAILEELKKSGALFLVTTHYPEVKNYALNTEHIVNARMTFDKESLKPLYQLVIGEAGESCAFYIAAKLGMPQSMIANAVKAAYGEKEVQWNLKANEDLKKEWVPRIEKKKIVHKKKLDHQVQFQRGDSVLVLPDQKIGIVCNPVDDKGMLQVQIQKKKILINQKRVKLQVPASQLYPDDYDFSIVFDSVETRKARHQMERKYEQGQEIHFED